MYQRDYILRMIEMIGDLIAGILGLIKKGEFDKATQSLEDAYYEYLKEDASFLQSIPIENLTYKLLTEHNYVNGQLEILAELFYAEAELSHARGNKTKSLEFYEKSLVLLEFVFKESKTFSPDKQSKKDLIQNRITELKNTFPHKQKSR